MKRRLLNILSAAILCVALATPQVALAQRHGGNGQRTEKRTSRSGGNNNGGRSGNIGGGSSSSRSNSGSRGQGFQKSTRKNNFSGTQSGGRPGSGNQGMNPGTQGGGRPGSGNQGINSGTQGGGRPGSGNQGINPGTQGGGRPGGNQGMNPGNNVRPGGNNHNQGWGGASNRPAYKNPPHRPNRPAMARPYAPPRPVPPHNWRPGPRVPALISILGIAFGTAIGLSLDYLMTRGYTVDGYGNDVVYLRNVAALNRIWTDAALYYGAGGLDASTFYYSTPRYDMSRYNYVYNDLVGIYGPPVNVVNNSAGIGATWFAGNQGYITLNFGASSVGNGLRYLTTLSFGL